MTNTPVPAVADNMAGDTLVAEAQGYPVSEINREEKEALDKSINTELYVRHYFSDIPILAKIAYCESRFRQFNKKGAILRGEANTYDVGVMQINELYHGKSARERGENLNTLEGNLSHARYLYEKEGARPWMASSPCWAKFTQSEIAKAN